MTIKHDGIEEWFWKVCAKGYPPRSLGDCDPQEAEEEWVTTPSEALSSLRQWIVSEISKSILIAPIFGEYEQGYNGGLTNLLKRFEGKEGMGRETQRAIDEAELRSYELDKD